MIPAIEFLLILGSTLLLLALARGRATLSTAKQALVRMVLEPGYRWPLCLAVLALGTNLVETQFDGRLTAALGYDLTGWVYRLEGDFAAGLQHWDWPPAIYAFTYIYIMLFMAPLIAPLLLTAGAGNRAAYLALCRGLILNYLIAIPFYLFFPVREMWSGNSRHVRLLVDKIDPAIMEVYRGTSALDNCFPSLHTSLSLTVALIAGRHSPRLFSAALWLIAAAVLTSTVYLGIHWITDLAAGITLTVFVSWAAQRRLPAPSPLGPPEGTAAPTQRQPELPSATAEAGTGAPVGPLAS